MAKSKARRSPRQSPRPSSSISVLSQSPKRPSKRVNTNPIVFEEDNDSQGDSSETAIATDVNIINNGNCNYNDINSINIIIVIILELISSAAPPTLSSSSSS